MAVHNLILSGKKFEITLQRLCHQLIENHGNFSQSAIIGLQPRGIYLAKALHRILTENLSINNLRLGFLDATFHRDDFRTHKGPLVPSTQNLDFQVEKLKVILVDDVLFTGRTIRSGMDALLDYGRPDIIELLVLVDRRYSRQLPIEPNYVGLTVDTRASQRVKVTWNETEENDAVILLSTENKEA